MATLPFPVHSARAVLLAFVLLAGLALVASARADQPAPVATIDKLLPADTAITVSAETAGLTEGLARLQAVPKVKTALESFEQTLGFSLAHDVLPWAGQLDFALLDMKADNPRMLLLLEIRDPVAFQQALPLLQTQLERLSGRKWSDVSYEGIDLRYATTGGDLSVAWGQVGGWLAIGIGDGAIRKGIDAWMGKTPTLAENAAWAKCTAAFPPQGKLLWSLNGDALAKIIADSPTGKMFNAAALQGITMVASKVETADTARFDVTCAITSAERQQQLRALKAALTPVDGTASAQLPPGAFAAMFSSNPAKYADYYKQQWLSAFTTDPATKEQLEAGFAFAQPLLQILAACSGPSAAAACWTPEQGFGLALVNETPSAAQASTLVTLLSAFAKTIGHMSVTVTDGVSSLPEKTGDNDGLRLQVCWTAKDAWIKCATAPAWLAGSAGMQLPPESLGADGVFVANLRFLASLREQLETRMLVDDMASIGERSPQMTPAHAGVLAITALRLLGLDKMQMVGYSRIADDGASTHAVLEVSHVQGMGSVLSMAPMAAAVLYPVFMHAREKARQTQSISNLKQLDLAAMMDTQDNDEIYPMLKTTEDIKRLMPNEKVYTQPSSHLPYLPNPALAGKPLGEFADPVNTITFYEQSPYADGGRCVAFLDGHVAYVSAKDWAGMKAKAGLK